MITISNQIVNGFEAAFRGMRNPLESWEQTDSWFGIVRAESWDDAILETRDLWMAADGYSEWEEMDYQEAARWMIKAADKLEWLSENSTLYEDFDCAICAYIGPKDMNLAQRLIRAGADESKFLRQINVSVDITAPLYWWKEADTYKVGTTANSTPTMHKLSSRPIRIDDFSFDKDFIDSQMFKNVVKDCEWLRQKYVETKENYYWRALIQLLPESYNQTRTWTANYAVLRNIYFARRNHKLDEWRDFCKWIESLPYSKELICLEEKKGK